MTPQSRQHAAMLEQVQRGMAELALDALWERDPTMEQRYGAAGRRIWRAELASRLAHLSRARSPTPMSVPTSPPWRR
jgi:hypothetical protein